MQSIFRLPWCGDQIASKMSEKPSLDQMRSSPVVEIPGLSQFKRKRTSSPEPQAAPQTLAKKPRPASELSQRLPLDIPQLPAKSDSSEQTNPASLAYATPGATPTASSHRSDYLPTKPVKSESNIESKDIATAGASRKDSAVGPPRHSSTQQTQGDVVMDDAPTAATTQNALKQAIDNQINMQILMKHNELRFIDQELAKCQVALEQLRRCELRPFPGSQHPTESVSNGTGPAILPQSGFTKPSHAAPHGVTDGPYSRHYRIWLLGDSQFDSEPIRVPSFADSVHSANRPTRNSGSARKSTGKSVGNIPGEYLPSIPNYPAAPTKKEKSGPLILKRSNDNKLVKLVCNNCNRGDMNSIQGFLNHCRIAHKVDYKSHDQAALDCGRPLDQDEIASLPADAGTISTAKPAPRPTPARASTTVSTMPVPVPTSNTVHPFNVPGAALPESSRKPTKKRAATPARPVVSPPANNTSPSTFKPSSQAPRLSALFAKNSFGGDLNQAVANAKQKVDLSAEEDTSSPEVSTPNSPSVVAKGTGSSLGMPTVPAAAPRPPSRKGQRPPQQRPRPSPLAPTVQQAQPSTMTTTPTHLSESPHLSPHTADSMPGMISDLEEDDDHGSASEEETTLPSSRGKMLPVTGEARTCGDSMDLDIAVDDEMDEHGVIIRRNSMLGSDDNQGRQRKLASTASPSKLG